MPVRSRARRIVCKVAAFALVSAGIGACVQTPQPAGQVEIEPLTEGVWLHRSYYTYPGGTRFPSNGLIVREGDELLLIDTAWGELATLDLLRTIDARIGLRVGRAIITHAHGDRIAGADVLEARGIPVDAHPLTRQFAIASGLPVPDGMLEELQPRGSSLRSGRVEIWYPGPAHTQDNVVAWVADVHVLFGGCAVRAASSRSAGNTTDADLGSWLVALRDMQQRYAGARVVVPGHGEPAGIELLAHTARLVAEREAE